MSFTIRLCHNKSPVEKIGKNLDSGIDITGCLLKASTSILKPVITINSNDSGITSYNYMYISEFNRYYFIDDIVSVNNNKWEISAHVDVLETYKTDILANTAVIKRQTSLYNTYLNDPEWKIYANEKITAKKFPTTPFNKTLNALLVVAGA